MVRIHSIRVYTTCTQRYTNNKQQLYVGIVIPILKYLLLPILCTLLWKKKSNFSHFYISCEKSTVNYILDTLSTAIFTGSIKTHKTQSALPFSPFYSANSRFSSTWNSSLSRTVSLPNVKVRSRDVSSFVSNQQLSRARAGNSQRSTQQSKGTLSMGNDPHLLVLRMRRSPLDGRYTNHATITSSCKNNSNIKVFFKNNKVNVEKVCKPKIGGHHGSRQRALLGIRDNLALGLRHSEVGQAGG